MSTTADPSRIVAKARQSRELFARNGLRTQDNPGPVPPTIAREPQDSTETTTIYYETAGMARAVELSRQALGNLQFLKERNLPRPDALKAAEKSLDELWRFLGQNRPHLFDTLNQDKKTLSAKLQRNQRKLASLNTSFGAAKDPKEKSVLAGEINLANLNRRRLQRLLEQNQSIAAYLRGISSGNRGSTSSPKHAAKARKKEG